MKFIVITLLFLISFSGCIGDNDAVGKKTDTNDVSTITPASPQQPSEIIADPNATPSTVEPPAPAENTTTSTTPATPDPIPTTVPTSTTPAPNPNVTTTTVEPPSPNVTTTTTTIAPNVTTTTISPNVTTTTISPNVTTTTIAPPSPNVTTTIAPSPNVTTTTVAPPVTTTKRPTPTPCRRFDGPSFIGGIVLAVGLMAIGVVAYKFYKARTDRNYHTL